MKFLAILFLFSSFSFAKELALTFDDAPRGGTHFSGVQRTQRLLAKLKATEVDQVAFFCNTERMDEAGKKRIAAYSQAGHLIANHSHSHPDLHKTDAQVFIDDIAKAESLLKDFPTFGKWFRFPFLHEGETVEKRDVVRTALTSLGYRNGYVTVDNYDWYLDKLFQDGLRAGKKVNYRNLEKVYVRVLWDGIEFYEAMAQRTLGRSPKQIILLHENDLAALFIDKLVEKARAQGWTIISAEDAYTDPIATMEPETLFLGQGRIAAIARTKGDPGPFWIWEEESDLEKLFIDEKVFK